MSSHKCFIQVLSRRHEDLLVSFGSTTTIPDLGDTIHPFQKQPDLSVLPVATSNFKRRMFFHSKVFPAISSQEINRPIVSFQADAKQPKFILAASSLDVNDRQLHRWTSKDIYLSNYPQSVSALKSNFLRHSKSPFRRFLSVPLNCSLPRPNHLSRRSMPVLNSPLHSVYPLGSNTDAHDTTQHTSEPSKSLRSFPLASSDEPGTDHISSTPPLIISASQHNRSISLPLINQTTTHFPTSPSFPVTCSGGRISILQVDSQTSTT